MTRRRVIARAGCVDALPPLPDNVLETLSLLDRGADYPHIVDRLAQDPALASRVLQLANSAFYGRSGRVGTLREACMVLGTPTLRQAVLAVGAIEALTPQQDPPFSHAALWRHAFAAAAAARMLAELSGLDRELAATAGLLHDVGKLALNAFFAGEYAAVRQYQAEHGCLLHEAEMVVLGQDHTEVGYLLGNRWLLPEDLIRAIERHHSPDLGAPDPYVDIVHAADVLANTLELGYSGDDLLPELSETAWERLGLDWNTVTGNLAAVDAVRRTDLFQRL